MPEEPGPDLTLLARYRILTTQSALTLPSLRDLEQLWLRIALICTNPLAGQGG